MRPHLNQVRVELNILSEAQHPQPQTHPEMRATNAIDKINSRHDCQNQ